MSRLPRLLLPLLAFACVAAAAESRAEPVPIFDGHADFGIHYMQAEPGWSAAALDLGQGLPGQSDLPRWRAGAVTGAMVTVASDRGPGAVDHFPRLLVSIGWLEALVARHSDQIALVRSLAELRQARQDGRVALLAAVEGGDQIDGSLENLRTAHARGVRSMLIVYDHHNALGDGAMVLEQSRSVAGPPHGGLSPLGRTVVREMNRLGMIVDLSHAAEATALQAMALSTAPVLFSHSAARALADSPRNLSDDVLRRVAATGGLVMVPLAPYLLTHDHWGWWSGGEARHAELVAAHPGDEVAVARGMAEWDRANPQPVVRISHVADQVEHIARLAGPEHVGLGSDFDGMGSFTVEGLEHAGRLQSLVTELRRRGWSDDHVQAFAHGNFERFLGRVEAASGSPAPRSAAPD